jgi:hypothetical protein
MQQSPVTSGPTDVQSHLPEKESIILSPPTLQLESFSLRKQNLWHFGRFILNGALSLILLRLGSTIYKQATMMNYSTITSFDHLPQSRRKNIRLGESV